MKQLKVFAICFLSVTGSNAQSYPPAADQIGTTAIHKDDVSFVAWATGVELHRGYKKISDPSLGYVSSGIPENAIGFPSGAIVSLGDKGEAVITFTHPIIDEPGFDFAVFENGNVGYLELALVKVSSDGVNYFDFPAHSQTQATTQIGTFGTPSAEYLNNIAGKYAGNYGTPFDLAELPDDPQLDKNNITHIKIIDVVGSIDPQYATYDGYGNVINDSYPTPFESGGFDLQAVGVIHQRVLGINDFEKQSITIYPNPTSETVFFDKTQDIEALFYDSSGRIVKKVSRGFHQFIMVSDLQNGTYILELSKENLKIKTKIIIKH